MCVLALGVSSNMKCMFKFFDHFCGVFLFMIDLRNFFTNSKYKSLVRHRYWDYFSQSMACFFLFLTMFWRPKVLMLMNFNLSFLWLLCYAKSLQSCPTLCDPIDGSPPGSPVPGILQARTLEWVAISFSNAWKVKSESEVAQSCPTLSDPMDCSLTGSSIHGIFQARVLEWGAIAFSL